MPNDYPNIYIEFKLFIDPPTTETAAMKRLLEEQISKWNNNINANPQFKTYRTTAKKFIADGLPGLAEMAKNACEEKRRELEAKAEGMKEYGVTEASQKKLVNEYKVFFKEETIRRLVPLDSANVTDTDEFIAPAICPASLQFASKGSRPSYKDMKDILADLRSSGGKTDLYDFLGFRKDKEPATADVRAKARVEEERIRKLPKNDVKADIQDRLSKKFMLYFQDDDHRRNYDVALKRFSFDETAENTLTYPADAFLEKRKTDYKKYVEIIDKVKKLGYTQEEAEWLVYEYFCKKKGCPEPVKPKKGIGWGKYENIHAQLVFIFKQSIEYHKTNPRIKDKLQSVIEQFNEITDPDSVESTVKRIINDDLRKFWESCKYDGISSNDLFMPTVLANFPNLQGLLNNFTLNN